MGKAKKTKPTAEVITPPQTLKRRIAEHPVWVRAVAAGLLLIALSSLLYFIVNDPPASSGSHVCSDQLLQEAGAVLDPPHVNELGKITDKIKTLKNFDRDPNCLNVVVTYYIHKTDYTNARLYLDKLEAVYHPSDGFSSVLGVYARNIDNLRANVDFLKKIYDNGVHNRNFKLPGDA